MFILTYIRLLINQLRLHYYDFISWFPLQFSRKTSVVRQPICQCDEILLDWITFSIHYKHMKVYMHRLAYFAWEILDLFFVKMFKVILANSWHANPVWNAQERTFYFESLEYSSCDGKFRQHWLWTHHILTSSYSKN